MANLEEHMRLFHQSAIRSDKIKEYVEEIDSILIDLVPLLVQNDCIERFEEHIAKKLIEYKEEKHED